MEVWQQLQSITLGVEPTTVPVNYMVDVVVDNLMVAWLVATTTTMVVVVSTMVSHTMVVACSLMVVDSYRRSLMMVVDSCSLIYNLMVVALKSSLMVVASSRNLMIMVVVPVMVNPMVVLTLKSSLMVMVVVDSRSRSHNLVVVDSHSLMSMVVVKLDVADKVASLLGIATPAAVALVAATVMPVALGGVAEAEELVGQSYVSAVAELVT